MSKLTSMLCKAFGPASFKVMAPTRAAAINVEETTLHSGLKIYGNMINLTELSGEKEHNLQLEYENLNSHLSMNTACSDGAFSMPCTSAACSPKKCRTRPSGTCLCTLLATIGSCRECWIPRFTGTEGSSSVMQQWWEKSFSMKSFALAVPQRQNANSNFGTFWIV